MEPRGGRGDGPFVLGKVALEALQVFRLRLALDETGKWCFAQGKELLAEFFVWAVVEEAQGAPAAGGVVDDFGHNGAVFAEVELVADAYLAGRIDDDIPVAQVGVELAAQEHFDACAGLLLAAVETGGQHFGVVEHEDIVLAKIVEEVLEHLVFNLARLAVEHHHAAFVAVRGGVEGNFFFG